MFQKKIINRAVVSVISAGALGATAAMTQAQMLEEVVVTATKKSESMQDVAISVQAMTGQSLREQNVTSFEDYVMHLPSVNRGGRGLGRTKFISAALRSMPLISLLLSLKGRRLTLLCILMSSQLQQAGVT